MQKPQMSATRSEQKGDFSLRSEWHWRSDQAGADRICLTVNGVLLKHEQQAAHETSQVVVEAKYYLTRPHSKVVGRGFE
jgi:hypothetical protein